MFNINYMYRVLAYVSDKKKKINPNPLLCYYPAFPVQFSFIQ